MSCFGKVASGLQSTFNTAKEFAESKITSYLSKKYPDLQEVKVVLDKIKERVNDDNVDNPVEVDNKWQPTLLTVALLCKLQKLTDHMEEVWLANAVIDEPENEENLLNVFGCYWHLCAKIGEGLRSSVARGGYKHST